MIMVQFFTTWTSFKTLVSLPNRLVGISAVVNQNISLVLTKLMCLLVHLLHPEVSLVRSVYFDFMDLSNCFPVISSQLHF